MPFENSTNGSVVQTLDLFADRQQHYSNVYVCGEAYLDVHHYLLGYSAKHHSFGHFDEQQSASGDATPTYKTPNPLKPKSHPLTDLRHVKRVYSHPQAFGQCEAFLSTYLKGVERQEVSSTSKAAEVVKMDVSGVVAAISSKTAAEVHGLEVLGNRIEDRDDNTTRFFFLRRGLGGEEAEVLPANLLQDRGRSEIQSWKSLIAFTIDHRTAGALAAALMVFKSCDLNLTSINTRPSRLRPWHYIFFVEFEGEGPDDVRRLKLSSALDKLGGLTQDCRWHGSWKNRQK